MAVELASNFLKIGTRMQCDGTSQLMLYCDPDGTLYDPVQGREDIEAQQVRFIGKAQARISEDSSEYCDSLDFCLVRGGGCRP